MGFLGLLVLSINKAIGKSLSDKLSLLIDIFAFFLDGYEYLLVAVVTEGTEVCALFPGF